LLLFFIFLRKSLVIFELVINTNLVEGLTHVSIVHELKTSEL